MSNFLFLRISYHKCHCRWSIKLARPSFGRQNIYNGKQTPVRDLCGSKPGYLMPKKDDSLVRYLGWLG